MNRVGVVVKRGNRFNNVRIINGNIVCNGMSVPLKECVERRRTYRAIMKRLRRDSLLFHDNLSEKTAGHYLRVLEARRLSSMGHDKKPTTKDDHVGVEIEFLSPKSSREIKLAFAKAGLHMHVVYHSDSSVSGDEGECDNSCRDDCECLDENGDGDCQCECSGSCRNSGDGHEVCVIATVSQIEPILERVCSVLNDRLDASVNKTCGLHVHLDQRGRSGVKAYRRLVNALPLLTAVVPASRLTNTYCKRNEPTADISDCGSDRYWMVNPQSLKRHHTIEVRLHAGTTDSRKIINWVRLLRWLAFDRRGETTITSFKQLMYEHLASDTVFYLMERFKEFGAKRTNSGNWVPLDISSTSIMTESFREAA